MTTSAICAGCGIDKPVTEYYRRNDRPIGRLSRCKECVSTRNREQQSSRKIVGTPEWRKRTEYFRRYAESGQRSKAVNARYRRLKDAVIDGYGGRCNKCGFDDRRALQVDHVNGDGASERAVIGAAPLWRRLIRDGFPDTHQVLCANCNTIKMYEGREFPGWQSFQLTASA